MLSAGVKDQYETAEFDGMRGEHALVTASPINKPLMPIVRNLHHIACIYAAAQTASA